MSDPGLQRIQSFSRATWSIGSIVVLVIALVSFPRLYQAPDGRIVVEGEEYAAGLYGDDPWLAEEPTRLEIVDDTIHGDQRGGYLPFPASADPLVVSVPTEYADSVHLRQSVGPVPDEVELPPSIGHLWEPEDRVYLVPGQEDGGIWFATDDPEWSVTVRPVDAEPLIGTASGQGSAVLAYRGDALSARFTHAGAGIFQVTIAAPGELRLAVNDVDEVNSRASWDTPGVVLFLIDAPGEGTWTVTVDE